MRDSIEKQILIGEDSAWEFKSVKVTSKRVTDPDSKEMADEIGERQFARNELICTGLARCPLTESVEGVLRSRIMDRRGEGVPVIISATRRLSHRDPVFRLLDDSELQLTIYSVPTDNPSALHDISRQILVHSKKIIGLRGEKLVFNGENLVRDGEKLVLEGVSIPTLQKIALVCEHVDGSEFTVSDLVSLMPRSSAIALMAKMKKLSLIKPAQRRGRYVFGC